MYSDTNPKAEKVQIELIRKASVAERISLVRSLTQTTVQLARRAIKRANPNLSDREIDILFVEIHYGTQLADRLREYFMKSTS